jgi:1-acyl-sn-glycerol-3-phosphate acyltransferase
MKYIIAKFIFLLTGWKLDASKENIEAARNSVMIAAPHTSNFDLIFTLGAFWLMRLPIKFFIKKFYMKWYFFGVFKWLGAIGVDRSKNGDLVSYATELMKVRNDITLMVPAEGTRRAVDRWKTGFYYIALHSGKSISLGYLDYKKKQAGILEVIPTDEKDKTFDRIEAVYSSISAKHPEYYNKKIH